MRTCTICSNVHRAEIDAALLSGHPALRAVAQQYGCAKTSLLRHKAHIGGRVPPAAEQAAEPAAAPSALLSRLQRECSRLGRLARKAERSGDVRGAVAATDSLCRQLQQLIKLFAEETRRTEAAKGKKTGFEAAWLAAQTMPVSQIEGLVRRAEAREAAGGGNPTGAE